MSRSKREKLSKPSVTFFSLSLFVSSSLALISSPRNIHFPHNNTATTKTNTKHPPTQASASALALTLNQLTVCLESIKEVFDKTPDLVDRDVFYNVYRPLLNG
jgi:hypothetical protein